MFDEIGYGNPGPDTLLGRPMVPETEGQAGGVLLDLTEDALCGLRAEEDCRSDAVPYGTRSEDASTRIHRPQLVSIWKYMLSPAYANRRLALYTFLNHRLRSGKLSETVGFQVRNRRITRKECELLRATFWKIDRERFWADVEVSLTLLSPEGPRVWEGSLICLCGFTGKQFSMSVNMLTDRVDWKESGCISLDEFLVPVYKYKQMDKIADDLWLAYHMPEAITDPRRRNARELAERMGLTIRYLDVYDHPRTDSMIFFADADLLVGEDRIEKLEDGGERVIRSDHPETVHIPADTVVVNTNRIRRDCSSFRIFHECIHYRLHYLFFRLQDLAGSDPLLMKVTEVEAEDGKRQKDPLFHMENQANRGAFALMMPAGDTDARIRKECADGKTYRNAGEKFEQIGMRLSAQLGYPHFRVKPRMIQLGYIAAKGALNYVDHGRRIRPFACNPNAWSGSEVTFVIWEKTFRSLYQNDADFRAVIDTGKYIYADGHVVRNLPRFVRKEGKRFFLTEEAAGRVDDCCLRFIRKYVQTGIGEYVPGRLFYDPHFVARTEFYLSDLMNRKKLNELDAKMEYRKSFPIEFVKAFDRIMELNGETREGVAERLHISADTLKRRLYNPEEKITFDFVIRITLMWQIPDWLSELLLDRAYVHVNRSDRRHEALEHIRKVLWDLGITEANNYLESNGLELLEPYDPVKTESRKRRSKSDTSRG